MIYKIKRVMHGLEQGLDIVITLILFEKRLPSEKYNMSIVGKMSQKDVPWGLLKVNRVPSLRMGKAGCASQLRQWDQRGITLTSAIGLNVSITHLILPMALSHAFGGPIG